MIRIRQIRIRRANLATRMPFRYGIAEMTALPHLILVMDAEVDGGTSTGVSADHLPPKWFTKDPERDPGEEIEEMLAVVQHAASTACSLSGPSIFDLYRRLDERQAAWGDTQGLPPLLYQLGIALVERALIDAYCRRRKQSFAACLRENAFGVELGVLHPELAGSAPAEWLPERPLAKVCARHTIGLSDPVREAEIPTVDRLHDGLPQSIEACIDRYGLQHFKVKFGDDVNRELGRLADVFALILERVGEAARFTLDGNESFREPAQFRDFWSRFSAEPAIAKALPGCLFVEQPFHRDVALGDQIGDLFATWPDRPPIIIDESDATLQSLPRALELGYAGTSHKNCKGVFKGVANACLLAKRRREGTTKLIMSGEDLTNIAPIALGQDLAVQAALGNASVERNGHHYFRGLSIWPPQIAVALRSAHPGLFETTGTALTTLRIDGGQIDLHSVNQAPFGVAPLFEDLGSPIDRPR